MNWSKAAILATAICVSAFLVINDHPIFGVLLLLIAVTIAEGE